MHIAQEHLEESVAELFDLRERKLFTEEEICGIVARRRRFETQISDSRRQKVDYMNYIAHEINLEFERRERSKRQDTKGRRSLSDTAILKRISRLFWTVCRKFAEDRSLWLQFADFCRRMKWRNTAQSVLLRALQSHATCVEFWLEAVRLEVQMEHFDSARSMFMRALRVLPGEHRIWKEFLDLEFALAVKASNSRGDESKGERLNEDEHNEDDGEVEASGEAKEDFEEDPELRSQLSDAAMKIKKKSVTLEVAKVIFTQAIASISQHSAAAADLFVLNSFRAILRIHRSENATSIEGVDSIADLVWECMEQRETDQPIFALVMAAVSVERVSIEDRLRRLLDEASASAPPVALPMFIHLLKILNLGEEEDETCDATFEFDTEGELPIDKAVPIDSSETRSDGEAAVPSWVSVVAADAPRFRALVELDPTVLDEFFMRKKASVDIVSKGALSELLGSGADGLPKLRRQFRRAIFGFDGSDVMRATKALLICAEHEHVIKLWQNVAILSFETLRDNLQLKSHLLEDLHAARYASAPKEIVQRFETALRLASKSQPENLRLRVLLWDVVEAAAGLDKAEIEIRRFLESARPLGALVPGPVGLSFEIAAALVEKFSRERSNSRGPADANSSDEESPRKFRKKEEKMFDLVVPFLELPERLIDGYCSGLTDEEVKAEMKRSRSSVFGAKWHGAWRLRARIGLHSNFLKVAQTKFRSFAAMKSLDLIAKRKVQNLAREIIETHDYVTETLTHAIDLKLQQGDDWDVLRDGWYCRHFTFCREVEGASPDLAVSSAAVAAEAMRNSSCKFRIKQMLSRVIESEVS